MHYYDDYIVSDAYDRYHLKICAIANSPLGM